MADATNEHGDIIVFHRPRWYLYFGIVCTVFFGTMGIASFLAAWFNMGNSFPYPKTSALIFGGFWGMMTALGLWIVCAYYRERLIITPTTVTAVGCFKTCTMLMDEIESARWRLWPQGGSIKLIGNAKKLVIEFGHYTRAERDTIVAYFRHGLSPDVQQNWEAIAKPKRPPSPIAIAMARHIFAIHAWIFLIFAIIFAVVWLNNQHPRAASGFATSIIAAIVLGAYSLRRRRRRHGDKQP